MREDNKRSSKANLNEIIMERKILYIQYTNPANYPPLEHSSRILASNNWAVLCLGTDSLSSSNKQLSFPPHAKITVKVMPFCSGGWQQKLHYLRFCFWIIGCTLSWKPEWVYASDLLSCPIAWLLSFLPGVRLIYHEHDSPKTTPNSSFMALCLLARKWLASKIQLCILPNQERSEVFSQETNRKENLICVWNCPSQEEIKPPRLPHEGDLWVYYHGSMVSCRLPPTVLEALAVLPETVKLRAIGYETIGERGYVQKLQALANQLGLSQRVEFLESMPRRSELLQWCRKCDVGLAFMPENPKDVNEKYMAGASNKPFDYLTCGLALAVSDLPDWRGMYVEPGYGLACNPKDPESIARVLDWFGQHPERMRQMGERGRERIGTEWNYEQQFLPVLKRLEDDRTKM